MKFNWGTGIFIFLILFVVGAVGFVIFTLQFDVNLVHKDYYEKGVDYSEQMRMDTRSATFKNAIQVIPDDKFLVMAIEESLSSKIDSGNVLLFRPSDSKRDISIPVEKNSSNISVSKSDLIHGRYILKFSWYSEGIKYEIDRPINIQ
jgi:hypothetical protein